MNAEETRAKRQTSQSLLQVFALQASFALEAEIPTLLRTGALGALGGQLGFLGDISALRKQ